MTKKFIKNFIGLALITTTVTYATNTVNLAKIETNTHITTCYFDCCMSTKELEKEIESLIVQDKLPFAMGLELIKRWIQECDK